MTAMHPPAGSIPGCLSCSAYVSFPKQLQQLDILVLGSLGRFGTFYSPSSGCCPCCPAAPLLGIDNPREGVLSLAGREHGRSGKRSP